MKMFMALALAVLLAGCATKYDVVLCNDNGVCSEAHIKSFRNFDQPQVRYSRETGTFEFGAASTERSISPLEYVAADIARAAVLSAAPREE